MSETIHSVVTPKPNTFTFPKKEKLTGTIRIDTLYKEGKSFVVFPLFIVVRVSHLEDWNKVLISVPKRKYKNATDRNLLKRRIREAYRLNKSILTVSGLDIAFNYIAKTKLEYKDIEKKMQLALKKINQQFTLNDTHPVD